MSLPQKIVIEGPIGCGKTTLAKKIAFKRGGEVLLEPVDNNPFLTDFYKSEDKKAFATQMYFLIHRYQMLQSRLQQLEPDQCLIIDYLIEKEQIFAKLTLEQHELELYRQVHAMLPMKPFVPDLVIYLQASPDIQWQRIQRRGNPYENTVPKQYLEQLDEYYADFFTHYQDAPLLVVNTDGINIADNDYDFELLMDYVAKIKTGRHYFNPISRG